MELENDLSFSSSQQNTLSFLFKQHLQYVTDLTEKLNVLNAVLDLLFQYLGKCRQVRIPSMPPFYNWIFVQLNKTPKKGLGKQYAIVSRF